VRLDCVAFGPHFPLPSVLERFLFANGNDFLW